MHQYVDYKSANFHSNRPPFAFTQAFNLRRQESTAARMRCIESFAHSHLTARLTGQTFFCVRLQYWRPGSMLTHVKVPNSVKRAVKRERAKRKDAPDLCRGRLLASQIAGLCGRKCREIRMKICRFAGHIFMHLFN